jgi:hypothetical protein
MQGCDLIFQQSARGESMKRKTPFFFVSIVLYATCTYDLKRHESYTIPALFAWLISYHTTVFFPQNKSASAKRTGCQSFLRGHRIPPNTASRLPRRGGANSGTIQSLNFNSILQNLRHTSEAELEQAIEDKISCIRILPQLLSPFSPGTLLHCQNLEKSFQE